MDGQEATDVGQTAKNNSSGKQEQQQNPKQDELLSTLNNELNRRGGPKQGLTDGGDQKKVMTKENVVSGEVDLCPTSEARHLLLSLSIAEYEAQKERLLRLILKHNDEDRTCTHPDLVRVHPRPLEPGSEEVIAKKNLLYHLSNLFLFSNSNSSLPAQPLPQQKPQTIFTITKKTFTITPTHQVQLPSMRRCRSC